MQNSIICNNKKKQKEMKWNKLFIARFKVNYHFASTLVVSNDFVELFIRLIFIFIGIVCWRWIVTTF